MTPAEELAHFQGMAERLTVENARLRQGLLEACHRVSILAGRCYLCEYHPHPHTCADPSKAETVAIVRKSREHA